MDREEQHKPNRRMRRGQRPHRLTGQDRQSAKPLAATPAVRLLCTVGT